MRGMKYLCGILGFAMLFFTPAIMYTCRISQFVCRNNKCVSPDKYCDGVDDCGDMSDEPRFCTGESIRNIFDASPRPLLNWTFRIYHYVHTYTYEKLSDP